MTNIIDFNDARLPGRPERDVEALKARMADQARSILTHLLPAGRVFGQEFVVGDWHGRQGDSLKISLRPEKLGVGGDYQTGQMSGDLIDCWMLARGVDFTTACSEAESWLGLAPHLKPKPVVQRQQEELGAPTAQYHYRDSAGMIIATVFRYDSGDGKKTFRAWDAVAQAWRMPQPRPLYRLPELLKADRVIFTEGEKAAEALAGRGYTTTTAMAGSKAPAELTDWSPLAGRHVVVWPDADQVGLEHAAKVARAASAAGAASVRVLQPPPAVEKGWDAADAVQQRFDIEDFLADSAPAEPPSQTYKILDLDQLDTLPPPQWLLRGFVPKNSVACIYGPPGTLKTFVALAWGLSIAYGTPWFDHAVEQGGVLYVAGEGFHGMRNRVAAWRRHQGLDDTIAPIRFLGEAVPLLNPTAVNKLILTLDDMHRQIESPIRLVVIDTVARSMVGGDENSAQDMGLVIAAADAIRLRFNCAVLLIHHAGKDENRGPRGSSALRGAVDALMVTERDDSGKLTLSTEKQKDAPEHDPVYLKPNTIDLSDLQPNDTSLKSLEELVPSTSLVLTLGDEPFSGTRHKKPAKLTDLEANILNCLTNMLCEDRDKYEVVPGCPSVPRDELRDRLVRDGLIDGTLGQGLDDTSRKMWNRSINGLKAKGKIAIQGSYIWTPGHRDIAGT